MRLAPRLLLSCLVLLGLMGTSHSAIAAPPGGQLTDQVSEAYDQTNQYHGSVTVRIDENQGRWHITRQADFHVAFDRENQRLMIDRPDMYIVVADGMLRLKSDELPGRHLEMPMVGDVTYQALVEAVPFLNEPMLIDLVFLLAEDPVATLTGGTSTSLSTLEPGEGDTLPRLRIATANGPTTVKLDADTRLVTQASWDADTTQAPPGYSTNITYTYKLNSRNEALPDDLFAFNAPNSQAAASMQALLAGGGGGQGGGGRGPHPLVDQPAPPITLAMMDGAQFRMGDVEADVIILDFWATWSPPCREGLPQLQSVHDWAQVEGKSVAIYAVNIGETAQQAQAFWTQGKFTLPVLMDEQSQVAQAYAVSAIPQTVVIKDGKVRNVHVGLIPNYAETLKTEINALLAEPEDEQQD